MDFTPTSSGYYYIEVAMVSGSATAYSLTITLLSGGVTITDYNTPAPFDGYLLFIIIGAIAIVVVIVLVAKNRRKHQKFPKYLTPK